MSTVSENLPAVHSVPNDRVVHADRWQGTLDTPSAEDLEWLAEHPSLPPVEVEEFIPTTEDLEDYHRWCMHIERLDALRREDDAEYECRLRYGC